MEQCAHTVSNEIFTPVGRNLHFVTGKTAKSILISCGARLAVFDIAELREVTSYDELELDKEDDEHSCGFTTGVFQNQ